MAIESFEENKIERLEADIVELKKQLLEKSREVEILTGVIEVVRSACQVSSASHSQTRHQVNPFVSQTDRKKTG